MADKTTTDLRNIEKAMVKLRNKMKRIDLDYTVQTSVSSVDPTIVRYAAQLTAPANGLQPLTFIADSADELIEKIKRTVKKIDHKAVEKAYHAAQIEACNRTIKFHEERLADLDKPDEELEKVEEEA